MRDVVVTNDDDKSGFQHLMLGNIRVNLFDDYLWGSVICRQIPSHFTRVQRLTCITATLCLVMIASAMFYNTETNVDKTKAVEVGGVQFTFGMLYVALISTLITLPAPILMSACFNKSKRLGRVVPTTASSRGDVDENATHRSRLSICFGVMGWVIAFVSAFVSNFFLVLYSLQWGPEISKQWLVTQITSMALSAFIVEPVKVRF